MGVDSERSLMEVDSERSPSNSIETLSKRYRNGACMAGALRSAPPPVRPLGFEAN